MKIVNVYTALWMYKKYEPRDCLVNKDLYAMKPYWWSNPFNCRDWCNNDNRCGGFYLNNAQCIFRSYACGHNLIYVQKRRTGDFREVHLKQGS